MPNLLVLELQPDHVVGLEASVGRDGPKVLRAFHCAWTDEIRPDVDANRAGEFLRTQLAQAGATAEEVRFVLPRESVVARKLELPDAPDEDLPNLVRFQAATRLATPVDQLALDFLPLPPDPDHAGRNALAVTIDAKRLERGLKTCAAAGLTPLSVGISSVSVAELVMRCAVAPAQAMLIVYQQGTRVEISLIDGAQLVFAHSTRLPDGRGASHVQPLQAEINRSLVALSHSHPAVATGDVYLIQDGGGDPDVEQALRQRFESRLKCLTPADIAGTMSVPPGLALTAPVLGEFAAHQGRRLSAIDLLNPRRPPVARDVRKQRRISAAAAAAAVLIGGYVSVKWRISSREKTLAALQQEQADYAAAVKNGKPTLDTAAAFDEWRRTRSNPLQVMADWNTLSPPTSRLFMQDLEYIPATKTTPAQLRGNGFAREREDFNDWYRTLIEKGYGVSPDLVEQTGLNPDFPFQFYLVVDLPQATEGERPATSPQARASVN
jgi:Tfp pilus assembly protein PilN